MSFPRASTFFVHVPIHAPNVFQRFYINDILLFSRRLFSSLLFFSLLCSALLCSALLFSSLLFSSLLFPSPCLCIWAACCHVPVVFGQRSCLEKSSFLHVRIRSAHDTLSGMMLSLRGPKCPHVLRSRVYTFPQGWQMYLYWRSASVSMFQPGHLFENIIVLCHLHVPPRSVLMFTLCPAALQPSN